MILSIATKQGILAVALVDNGIVKFKETKSLISDKEKPTVFDNLIETATYAMVKLKGYIEEHPDEDSVVFEFNNSTFKKWIDAAYATSEYNESFSELLELMDTIPVKFSYAVVSKPQATCFLNKKFIKKAIVGGFESLGFDEEES